MRFRSLFTGMIENEFHPRAVYVSDVFQQSGANIGPGMICAYFLGEEISKDGSKEKELMQKAING